ncbi:MAG: hypothetical protein RSB88_08855, partial [Akkermansia sp.]
GKDGVTDWSNPPANVDYVVESWMSDDGENWYRKFKSGWIEQGGNIMSRGNNNQRVIFNAIFKTAPVYCICSTCSIVKTALNYVEFNSVGYTGNICWYACGFKR